MRIFLFYKKYLKKYYIKILIYVLLCIISCIASILLPHVIGNFIDNLILSNKVFLVYNCILFFCVNVLIIVTGYISNIIYTIMQSRIVFAINREILLYVKDLSLLFFENTNSAYLSQRINQDSNVVSVFCIQLIKNIIINVLMFIVPLYLIILYNKSVIIILIIISIIYSVTYLLCKKPLYHRNLAFKETQNLFFLN